MFYINTNVNVTISLYGGFTYKRYRVYLFKFLKFTTVKAAQHMLRVWNDSLSQIPLMSDTMT